MVTCALHMSRTSPVEKRMNCCSAIRFERKKSIFGEISFVDLLHVRTCQERQSQDFNRMKTSDPWWLIDLKLKFHFQNSILSESFSDKMEFQGELGTESNKHTNTSLMWKIQQITNLANKMGQIKPAR